MDKKTHENSNVGHQKLEYFYWYIIWRDNYNLGLQIKIG